MQCGLRDARAFGTVDSWTVWAFAITVWAVAVVAGAKPPSPLSDFLSRWFPWFFSLPQDQQAFLEVAVPSTVLLLLWLFGAFISPFGGNLIHLLLVILLVVIVLRFVQGRRYLN